MDILRETEHTSKKTFLNHVFSTTEESKAEVLNVVQYSIMGVIPIVILNKLIQRFIPEADNDKSSLEILVEIFIQLIVMFCGIIVVHRMITYAPTYSGFKYEQLTLTNVILAFLILVLSIQTKLGIKVNILVDRAYELWEGTPSPSSNKATNGLRPMSNSQSYMIQTHKPSQGDYLDNSAVNTSIFPPAPVATSKPQKSSGYDYMMGSANTGGMMQNMGPMAANGVLGSSFGSAW